MKYRCLPADADVIYRRARIYVCSTIQKQICRFHIAVLRCHMQQCCSSQGQTAFGGVSESEFGKPPMHQHRIGIQVSDMTVGTTIANLGMTDVKFPNPLFEGDTVNCTTTVVSKRASKSRAGAGIVEFHHKAFKQDGTLVAECHRNAFIIMRPK